MLLPTLIQQGFESVISFVSICTHRWPNWLFKLTPTLRLVPFSRFAPYGAA
jgi:hypothetical protein